MEINFGGKSKGNKTSKTVWGFAVLIAVVYAKAHGLIEASMAADAIEAISGIVGIAGIRDAIRKE